MYTYVYTHIDMHVHVAESLIQNCHRKCHDSPRRCRTGPAANDGRNPSDGWLEDPARVRNAGTHDFPYDYE